MATPVVPDIVIGRLPLYLRALHQLEAEGQEITSSHELADQLEISSAQIRKDLSHFGEFGKQGTGYNIEFLAAQIERILHLEQEWQVALVGVGDLGRALAGYNGFQHRGFHITHIFDNNPDLIGTRVHQFEVLAYARLQEVVREADIQIAMLAVPADSAQEVCDTLVEAGVKAILNYAPTKLRTPDSVHIRDIDPVIHLQHMAYYLTD
jgi:redox-sensing transcriptional repressor